MRWWGGGGTPLPPPPPAWITESYAGNFNAAAADAARLNPRFQNVDAGFAPPSPWAAYTGHPYELIRLHVALGAGLTGAGQLVAVVDDGFMLSHETIAGKTQTFGPTGLQLGQDGNLSSHGTHVAALIAGDSALMHGVAPNARLHLSSSFNTTASHLALATLDAAKAGAVAQNNSWGWLADGDPFPRYSEVTITQLADLMAANTLTLPQALFAAYGDTSASAYQHYIDALNTFQKGGVVVVALSNDDTLPNADVNAALPLLAPELAEAWIAVANGLFSLDGNLNITASELISAPCGAAAQFCLTADGTTWSAAVGWTGDYSAGTGTSYAAPQVSGAVALLAEAFPNLSPAEWTDRLLASATTNFAAFTPDGTTNFGNGVVVPWDFHYGQGVLNLEAALRPIGGLVVVNGNNVRDAERFALERSYMGNAPAFGDALDTALGGTDIAVFDALNGDFYLDAGLLVSANESTRVIDSPAIPRLAADGSAEIGLDYGSWGLAAGETPGENTIGSYTVGLSAVDGHTYLSGALGLSSETVAGTSVLSLAESTTAVLGRYDLGFAQFEQFGFVGTHEAARDGMLAGFGGALALDMGGFGLKLGATQIAEQGAFLGLTASDAFALPGDTAITAASLSASAALTDTLTLFGGVEYGVAFGGSGAGMVSGFDGASFSGFQLGVRADSVFTANDQLTFTASQPMRVESGTIAMRLPTGRRPNGDVVYDLVERPLAASGRQLDLGLSYAFNPTENGLFRFGLVYSFDAGHVAGAEAAAVGASFTQAF